MYYDIQGMFKFNLTFDAIQIYKMTYMFKFLA